MVTLKPFAIYAGADDQTSLIVLTALLVCLIPTTIGALLSAIRDRRDGPAGPAQRPAMSGRAVEAAGDVSTLLLDKTGTITLGSREAAAFVPVEGVTKRTSPMPPSSPRSPTRPRKAGRSWCSPRRRTGCGNGTRASSRAAWVEFTAQTRMSGVDLDGRKVRKGATGSVLAWVKDRGGRPPGDAAALTDEIAQAGGTPLLVAVEGAEGARVLGVIHLEDVVKEGMRERFGNCAGWASVRS